jgi:hypothetical protein
MGEFLEEVLVKAYVPFSLSLLALKRSHGDRRREKWRPLTIRHSFSVLKIYLNRSLSFSTSLI